MANDICLHPDLIDEVIEELYAVDVISQDELKKLKNEVTPTDPNIMMDVRHKEVKKGSLIDLDTKRKSSQVIKMKTENTLKETQQKVKNLDTIDKEILNTRKCLEEFKNKLEKKNKCLTNLILDLEKENEDLSPEVKMEGEERDSPVIVKLNDQDTIHYFNMHLDHLEMKKNYKNNTTNTWRPIEAKSPVINVITTLEDSLFEDCEDRSTISNDLEEIKHLPLYNLKPFHITTKSVETFSEIQTVQVNDTVPNNSPTFSVSVTLDEKNKLTSKQYKMTLKVVQTWKTYVKKKKIQKWLEKKESKLRIELLKKCVSIWIFNAKKLKDAKKMQPSKSLDTLEVVPARCNINQKTFGVGNFVAKAECDTSQEQKQTTGSADLVQRKSSEIKKNKVEINMNKVAIPSKVIKGKHTENQQQSTADKTEVPVHVKTLTLQDVGLTKNINQNTSQVCKKIMGKQMLETKGNMSSRTMGEPLLHRFEAQEKIIKQQRELIEKQNRVIFDLQAKCLEIESKLNWTLAERQLAEAEIQVAKGSVSCDEILGRKPECKRSKSVAHEGHVIKSVDKSDVIVKNMLERQAHCAQLAEQTKLRKQRIEEEKERLKLEQEEKQKQEKEEERRKRIMQLKLEQQIAQEKERNTIALKKIEAELVEKANKHYKNTLLRTTFKKLRSICLEVSVKSEDCERIYRLKLSRKVFNIWKKKVKQSIESKFEYAEKHYNERLLRSAWDKLCKIHHEYRLRRQVSEDLYSLKLQERMFRRWQDYTAEQFLHNCCKIELAERLHRRQLLRNYFRLWKDLPRLMFREREKEQRRQSWRHTVQQLIPDFTPAYVD